MFILTRNGTSKDWIVAQQDALSSHCLYCTRNGTSENRIAVQQEEPSRRTDLSDHSCDCTSCTVTAITRSLGPTISLRPTILDCYRTVIGRLNSLQIPQTYKIGLLSDEYRTVNVIARSDCYRTVIIFGVIARSDRYQTVIIFGVIARSDRYKTVKVKSLYNPSHRTIGRTQKILQLPSVIAQSR